jgi:dTDP-glucose 4,6-dehydratase
MLTQSYMRTYGIDVVTTRCSNNYWPYQDNEKLIPLFIHRLTNKQKVPLYGDGKNVRDRLYVEDHCDAIREVFTTWKSWEAYNVWGNNEYSNREITDILLDAFNVWDESIEYVEDRAGHDRRYAIDNTKITRDLWRSPKVTFEKWIQQTIEWYMNR